MRREEGGLTERNKQQELSLLSLYLVRLHCLSSNSVFNRTQLPPNRLHPEKAFTTLETPSQSLFFIPMLWAWLSPLFTLQSSYPIAGGWKACWCFTRILLEGENEKRKKQSCLRNIYTIGCKSFLMGSRVQGWGRDYQGKSGYGVTCIWPGVTLGTPPRSTLACRGRGGVQVGRLGLKGGWKN